MSNRRNPREKNRMLLFGVGIVMSILALIWMIQGTPLQP